MNQVKRPLFWINWRISDADRFGRFDRWPAEPKFSAILVEKAHLHRLIMLGHGDGRQFLSSSYRVSQFDKSIQIRRILNSEKLPS